MLKMMNMILMCKFYLFIYFREYNESDSFKAIENIIEDD